MFVACFDVVCVFTFVYFSVLFTFVISLVALCVFNSVGIFAFGFLLLFVIIFVDFAG